MNNEYSFYLFTKLRVIIIPSNEPYDILYLEDISLFKEYENSKFNIDSKGEYECMIDYLIFKKQSN